MKKIFSFLLAAASLTGLSSCQKYLDINKSGDSVVDSQAPMDALLTNVTINVGFMGGSDLQRWSALLTQQYSGQTTGGETQTQQYEKYLIQTADVNNFWSTIYATTLNDAETVISLATTKNAPAYRGVAKLLKAYCYQILVDAFGKVPYSQAEQTTANVTPIFDDGSTVYTSILGLIDDAINDLNSTVVGPTPGTNSTIYTGSFATKKANWIKFANTLKLRMLLHYSRLDPTGTVTKITSLVNSSSASFFASNADNFEMPFFNVAGRQNPIYQFAINRSNYLFANKFIVDLMNGKSDPRRSAFFTPFPANSSPATYVGAQSGAAASQLYSRMHSYLKGTPTFGTALANGSYNEIGTNGVAYTGDAPVRMLTFAEYNFIRAEAALMGAPGDPQAFYQAGITASMQNAGVPQTSIDAYIAVNGTLTGTNAQKLQTIIEEKYVASYGVLEEQWTDWRRTGYPAITKVSNAVAPNILRSLPFPQSEYDANPNVPAMKTDLSAKYVFWDN